MNVNERGTKKWTSLMLPEHIEMLEEINKEQERKERPIIDEQMKAENYVLLQEALEFDYKICIKYYAFHDYFYEEGCLLGMDGSNGVIYMEETEIIFDDVMEVSVL